MSCRRLMQSQSLLGKPWSPPPLLWNCTPWYPLQKCEIHIPCVLSDYPKPYFELIYSQDGKNGGEASNAFTVDLGFRKQYFIFRPAGTNLSGKGGGASVFHKGGDGGVVFQNGFNGSKGSGGGGASKGATQGGYGGDGYVEIYGSNM